MRFKGLAIVVPNLTWTIKELLSSGESTIVARGEATPRAPPLAACRKQSLLGQEAMG